jgi:hypothetical protein
MNYDPQILKSQQDFVRAVDKHGMPIDFAGEEPQEAETPAERAALWYVVFVIVAVAFFAAIAFSRGQT